MQEKSKERLRLNPDEGLVVEIVEGIAERMTYSGAHLPALATRLILEAAAIESLGKNNPCAEAFLQAIKKTTQEFLETTKFEEINKELFTSHLSAEAEYLYEEHKSSDLDTLTGIPKRRTLEEDFDKMIFEGNEKRDNSSLFSYISIDVNYFKKINDKHGHIAGDIVLQKVAEVFQELSRDTDKVYRVGGDEFVFLSKGNEKEVRVLLERLVKYFQDNPIKIRNNFEDKIEVNITISIASVSIDRLDDSDQKSLKALGIKADVALYDVKKSDRSKSEIFQVGVDDKVGEMVR